MDHARSDDVSPYFAAVIGPNLAEYAARSNFAAAGI
jgi:hypothetical protein